MSIPYLPLYVADYEADTAHLSVGEDGAYTRLLRLCWRTPGCSVPADHEWIKRRVRASDGEWESLYLPVLAEFFTTLGGRIFSRRLKEEHERITSTSQKRSFAGRKGGRPRKPLESNEKRQSPAKANGKHPDLDTSVSKDTDAGGVVPLRKRVFDAGKQLLADHGVRDPGGLINKWLRQAPDEDVLAAILSAGGRNDPVAFIGGCLRKRRKQEVDDAERLRAWGIRDLDAEDRERDSGGGGDRGSQARRDTEDDVPRMLAASAEEIGPVPVGDIQAGWDSVALPPLRAQGGRLV